MLQIRQRDILPGRGRPQLKASVASPAICVDVVPMKPKKLQARGFVSLQGDETHCLFKSAYLNLLLI